MLRFLCLVIISLVFACTTSSKTELNDQTLKPGSESSLEDNTVICTRERETGSHVTRKICRTSGQIEAEREAAQRILESRQRTTSVKE